MSEEGRLGAVQDSKARLVPLLIPGGKVRLLDKVVLALGCRDNDVIRRVQLR
jgi:hypothetical protein